MKLIRSLVAVAVILCTSFAVAGNDARKLFEQVRGLEGMWEGKNSQGQPLSISFRMTAGGSALLSEIHGQGPENMITMIHLDGDRLMLTHYCGAGNQPRMKVVASDAKSISFEFFDGTNIGPGSGHMQRVTFTQSDPDHHTEEWVFLDQGKEHKEFFTLERAK